MYNFDYFYGNEAEQYQFYMIPQLLFTDDKFRKLSSDAKILYGLLLDRSGLSFKNKETFSDENGRTFVYFTQETAMQMLNCAKEKVTKIFKELETIGLIEKKRQGLGKPTKIYVKHFNRLLGEAFNPRNTGIFSEVRKSNFSEFENRTSESSEIELQKVRKSNTNHTNINQTNINQTELSQSIHQPTAETEQQEEQIDRLIDRKHKMTFPEILEAIGHSDDYCYEKSEEDYYCFDEELRRTQKCEIPYSFVENKNNMIQSLKFLSAYSYHIENDGLDKTEIAFFNAVISSLAEVTTHKTIKVSGKTVKYHEIIDKLNSVISTSYLYDWYVEFKEHWENILAEKDRNNEKIKNLPVYLNSCIANYIMSYEIYGTADEMSANGFIRQYTTTDRFDNVPNKDFEIPIPISKSTGDLPIETKRDDNNISDDKPKEDTAKTDSDVPSAPDKQKLNEDIAAFMARLRGETLEQKKERQEQEEKNKQAKIKNAKYFKELFEERGEPFPMWLIEQLKELEIP